MLLLNYIGFLNIFFFDKIKLITYLLVISEPDCIFFLFHIEHV